MHWKHRWPLGCETKGKKSKAQMNEQPWLAWLALKESLLLLKEFLSHLKEFLFLLKVSLVLGWYNLQL